MENIDRIDCHSNPQQKLSEEKCVLPYFSKLGYNELLRIKAVLFFFFWANSTQGMSNMAFAFTPPFWTFFSDRGAWFRWSSLRLHRFESLEGVLPQFFFTQVWRRKKVSLPFHIMEFVAIKFRALFWIQMIIHIPLSSFELWKRLSSYPLVELEDLVYCSIHIGNELSYHQIPLRTQFSVHCKENCIGILKVKCISWLKF